MFQIKRPRIPRFAKWAKINDPLQNQSITLQATEKVLFTV